MPGRDRDAFRHARSRVGHVAVDGIGDIESILLPDAKHLHHHGWLAVEARRLVGFREAVNDFGDVAEQQFRAVGLSHQSEIFKLRATIGLAFGAQQYLAGLRLDRAPRQVERGAPDGIRQIVDRQPVAAHGFFGNLNGDLVRGSVDDFRLADFRQRDQILAHPLGQLLKRQLVGIT